MSTCKYCGKPAGFLRSHHKKCKKFDLFLDYEVPMLFRGFILLEDGHADPDIFRTIIETTMKQGDISHERARLYLLAGIQVAVDTAWQDKTLTDIEELRVQQLLNEFEVSAEELSIVGIADAIARAMTFKDLDSGVVRSRFLLPYQLPINLRKNEVVLWLFQNALRSEARKETTYQGGSQGFSVRIMSGLWYRVGSSKGSRIEQMRLVSCGQGDFVITNLAIYFLSAHGNFKMPISSIATVDQMSDAISITPIRGKQQYIQNIDIPFSTALILKLGQLI